MDTKVTLKFRDEDREFDLEKPEDFGKVKELAEKGWAYEGGQTELKTVSKERDELKAEITEAQEKLDNWNAILSEAQKGDTSKLIDFFRRTGIKIADDKKDDDEYLEDAASKKIKELEDAVKELKNKNESLESAVYTSYLDGEHARLEAKYNGEGGYPAYDRESVQNHSLKHGINDLEKAYRDLNYDAIVEARLKRDDDHKKKIDKVKSKEPDAGGPPPKPPKVYSQKDGGYEKANEDWFNEMKQEGKSVFVNDE